MGERKRVGGLSANLDPAIAEWQKQAAENPATVSKKRRRDRERVRIFVDITPGLKAALESIAGWEKGEDTSVSQATEMLLIFAARAYGARDGELLRAFRDRKSHARTPRFSWNVEVPEEWDREIEAIFGNGKVDGKVKGKV
ncbi:MAG: hypothetical protein JXR84_04330 [Anaerolineae bacterium]|nr:hypothetical protein [Anaerolineae bacterium]